MLARATRAALRLGRAQLSSVSGSDPRASQNSLSQASVYEQGYIIAPIGSLPMPLLYFTGKALLLANTASSSIDVAQFRGVQKIWDEQRTKGLMVLGLASNSFGDEPRTNDELRLWLKAEGITFPVLELAAVSGQGQHALFRWIERLGSAAALPKASFHKYVFNRKGRLLSHFDSSVQLDDARLSGALVDALRF